MQFIKWVTLLMSALCLVAVAGVMRAPHLYYMSALLITLPGVSYLLGWYALRGLEFEREMPPVAWEGEVGRLNYIVRNPTSIARFFLSVQETLPEWAELADADTPLFNVDAEDVAAVTQNVRFLRRGVFAANGFDVTALDPLGVFAFTRHIPAEGELVVYPMPQALRTTALTGAERYGWQEFTSRILRGSSVDPDGVRPYVPGDSMRRIHWRQTARTGKLNVIEFEEALASNLVIALDVEEGTDAGEGIQTTFETAVRMAASLAQEATSQGAGVRLMLPRQAWDAQINRNAAAQEGRGESQMLLVLDALARVEANVPVPLHQWLAEETSRVELGTTLAIVTCKPDMALPAVLAPAVAMGVKVGVVLVDAGTFRPDGNAQQNAVAAHRNEVTQQFLAAISALRLPTYVLRHQENGLLDPEEFFYG